jgi:hypothetical protein
VKTGPATTSVDCGTSSGGDTAATVTLDALPDGAHTSGVAACKDYSSSTTCDGSPATFTFTTDTVKPTLSVDGSPEVYRAKTSPVFNVSSTSSDLKEIQCFRADLNAWATCGPTFGWPGTTSVGVHAVTLRPSTAPATSAAASSASGSRTTRSRPAR